MDRHLALVGAVVLVVGLATPGPAAATTTNSHSRGTLVPRAVATFEGGSFAESLAAGPRGELYATLTVWQQDSSNLGRLYRIGVDGRMRQIGHDLGVGIMTGLAIDDRGNVYAGLVPFVPADEPPGVMRYAPDGTVQRVVTLPDGSFPNGLAYHDGALYISDSVYGAIWQAHPSAGHSETLTAPWLQDATLAPLSPYGLGANGIAFRGGSMYVVNAEAGTVLRIPVRKGATPGTPTTFVAAQAALVGADGIAFDAQGALWIVVNHGDLPVGGALIRVDAVGGVNVLANDPGWLDYPTQPAFGRGAGAQSLFVLNGSINSGNPNLIALKIGVRGAPLR